jgi:3-deoxy-7-phosphoheptulonate synthase
MSVFKTKGNPYGHVVLRGGGGQTNYDAASVADCEEQLKKANLPLNIVVDCSHGNSHKKPSLQPAVAYDCVEQIEAGNQSIVGLMLESHLFEGNQSMNSNVEAMRYGVSITDACMSWTDTEKTLNAIATRLRKKEIG